MNRGERAGKLVLFVVGGNDKRQHFAIFDRASLCRGSAIDKAPHAQRPLLVCGDASPFLWIDSEVAWLLPLRRKVTVTSFEPGLFSASPTLLTKLSRPVTPVRAAKRPR